MEVKKIFRSKRLQNAVKSKANIANLLLEGLVKILRLNGDPEILLKNKFLNKIPQQNKAATVKRRNQSQKIKSPQEFEIFIKGQILMYLSKHKHLNLLIFPRNRLKFSTKRQLTKKKRPKKQKIFKAT